VTNGLTDYDESWYGVGLLYNSRDTLNRLCLGLYIAEAAICTALHVATFFVVVPPTWDLAPFIVMVGAIVCAKEAGSQRRYRAPPKKWRAQIGALLIYAVLTLVYGIYTADRGIRVVTAWLGLIAALGVAGFEPVPYDPLDRDTRRYE
jgi:hypothetical protein